MQGAWKQPNFYRKAAARFRRLTGAITFPGARQWRPVAISSVTALLIVSCSGLSTTGPLSAAKGFTLASDQAVVGDIRQYVVQQGDVFPEIARRFNVGNTALVAANPGVDPWVPGVGRKITIPSVYVLPKAQHRGVVINLAQWRLFYFAPESNRVETFPVGVGQIGKTTPLGVTRVVHKKANPTWHPPASIRTEKPELSASVAPGPDNPLGAFALYLDWKSYLIHGTNKPDGVGRNVSQGCIRLYPEDIERLFGEVAVGTPVRVVSQPATAGWVGDRLYLAVYPSKTQTEEISYEHPVSVDPARGVRTVVREAAGRYADFVAWAMVDAAARARTGVPVIIADRSVPARRPGQPNRAQDQEVSMNQPGLRPL